MVKRRGQMKIQQMMFMILAITLFFVMAGMFFLSTSLSNLRSKAVTLQQQNAQLLVSKIANSPEFSCGNGFGTGMTSCIDMDKVMALKGVIKNYGNGAFWGVTGLEIREIFPTENGTECTGSNFPNCGKITLIPGAIGTGVSNFVSLCYFDSKGGNPYPKCNLGEIIVTYSGSVQ